MTLDTIKPANDTPEEKAKKLEALKQEKKNLLLDLLFSSNLRLQKVFSGRKIVEDCLVGIQSDEEKNEVKKELDALLGLLLRKNVIKRSGSSSFVAGAAMHEFPFDDLAKVGKAKEALLNGEGVEKPVATAPVAPKTPTAPAKATEKPKEKVVDFLPDDGEIDKLPLSKFDPDSTLDEALKNDAFLSWLSENKSQVGFDSEDLRGSDLARHKEKAEIYFAAYLQRADVAAGIFSFVKNELRKLSGSDKKSFLSEENFGASIESYLAKTLLENPKRILQLAKLIDDHAALIEKYSETEKKIREEIEKFEEDGHEKVLADLSSLNEEEALLKGLKKMADEQVSGVDSSFMERAFSKVGSFLNKIERFGKIGKGKVGVNYKLSPSSDFLGSLIRSKEEEDLILKYEKFRSERGQFSPISSQVVADRLEEIERRKHSLIESKEKLENAKSELKDLEGSVNSSYGAVLGALRITQFIKDSTEAATVKYLKELTDELDDEDGTRPIRKLVESLGILRSAKPGLDASHAALVDEAEKKLKKVIFASVADSIKEEAEKGDTLTAKKILNILSEPLRILFAEKFSFGNLTRGDYKELLLSALSVSADSLLKEGKLSLAGAVRAATSDIKNANLDNNDFLKEVGIEKRPVKKADVKKSKSGSH